MAKIVVNVIKHITIYAMNQRQYTEYNAKYDFQAIFCVKYITEKFQRYKHTFIYQCE